MLLPSKETFPLLQRSLGVGWKRNGKAIKSILDFHFLSVTFPRNNDLFISCLMQASFDYCSKYLLEVAIRKASSSKILGVELINRNEIYCLEATSWRVI